MSHHGREPFDLEARKQLIDSLKSTESYRGPIGAYPDGKLTKRDEGNIQFAIGSKDGKVVMDFGSAVAWIGMTPQDAMDLAAALMRHARKVASENGETVHIIIG